MAQYTFPKSYRSKILEIINPERSINVNPMDSASLRSDESEWWRYVCTQEDSRALLYISEHKQIPTQIIVTISIDSRRLLTFWLLRKDWQLKTTIENRLKASGGELLDGD